MLDTHFTEKASQRNWWTVQRRCLKLFVLVWFALLLSSLLGFQIHSRYPYTCAVCRAEKVDHHLLGMKWSAHEETECSRWYSDHVERSHTHAWITRGYCRRFGIPGLVGGYACVVGGPLTGLSRTVQIQIYEHFQDPLLAKRLFIRLGQTDPECNRIWQALMAWVDQDYPGTWDDWYKKQLAIPESP
jgi:hypothetical protein